MRQLGHTERSAEGTLPRIRAGQGEREGNTMAKPQISLLYIDDMPEGYFADFIDEVRGAGVKLEVASRENEPFAALEWAVLTAVAIYLSKPFIDAFLKRLADDATDAVYAKVKAAVTKLAEKLLIRDRGCMTVISSSPNKVKGAASRAFSIYSETRTQRSLKFVYNDTLTSLECEQSFEQVFTVLQQHHNSIDDSDLLSEQIAKLENPSAGTIYLFYEAESNTWSVIDPLKMARELHREQSGNAR